MIGTERTYTLDILSEDASSVEASGVRYETGAAFHTDELSNAGAFSVKIHESRPEAAAAVTSNHIRFKVAGQPDRTGRIEQVDKVPVARKPSERVRVVKGRDWLCHFDDAGVDPPLGVNSKPAVPLIRFDWTHPALDTSSWTTPVNLGPLFTANRDAFGDPYVGVEGMRDITPEGWPDVFTTWYWGEAANINGSHETQNCYFHVETDTLDEGPFVPVFTGRSKAQLAFDGAVIDPGVDLPSEQWTKCVASGIQEVSATTHVLRMKVEHIWDPGSNPNPGAVALVCYQPTVSNIMSFQNVVLRTGDQPGGVDYNRGGNWKCFHDSGAPKFTIGEAFRILFEQAQAHDALQGWTLGFTDTVDSRGTAWTPTDILTANIDQSLLDVMVAWHDLSEWEFAARPDEKVLDAWVFGQRGNYYTSPVSPLSWDGDNVYRVDAQENR